MNPLRSGGEVNEITDFSSKISRVSLSEPSFLSQNFDFSAGSDFVAIMLIAPNLGSGILAALAKVAKNTGSV